jgi:hypothetical protein
MCDGNFHPITKNQGGLSVYSVSKKSVRSVKACEACPENEEQEHDKTNQLERVRKTAKQGASDAPGLSSAKSSSKKRASTGYLADIIGRKYMFALTYVFCFVGITLEVVATTNEIFFAGKFIAGFAIGGFITTSMTYIGEVAPLALRGVLTAASAIAFTLGPFIVSLIVNSTGSQDSRWAYRTVFVCQSRPNAPIELLNPSMCPSEAPNLLPLALTRLISS